MIVLNRVAAPIVSDGFDMEDMISKMKGFFGMKEEPEPKPEVEPEAEPEVETSAADETTESE